MRVHSFSLATVKRRIGMSSRWGPEGEEVEVSAQVVDVAMFVTVGVSQREES